MVLLHGRGSASRVARAPEIEALAPRASMSGAGPDAPRREEEIMRIVKVHDDFPDEILRLVGQIVIGFAQLEHVLKLLVKRHLHQGFDEGMAEAERIRKINALRKRIEDLHARTTLDQRREADLAALLRDAEDLYQEDRTRIVHALWAHTVDGRPIRVFRERDWGISLDELNMLRCKLRALVLALNGFGLDAADLDNEDRKSVPSGTPAAAVDLIE